MRGVMAEVPFGYAAAAEVRARGRGGGLFTAAPLRRQAGSLVFSPKSL